MSPVPFKQEHPLGNYSYRFVRLTNRVGVIEKRKAEGDRVRAKYPDRLPVCISLLSCSFLLLTVLIAW